MNNAIVALVSLIASLPTAPPAARDAAVRIYLPPKVKADGEQLRLGQLGVIVCEDPRTEAAARDLAMGRTPWPKEVISIDRTTILSRLAGHGIRKERVRFTGAEKVAVTRDERTIAPRKLLAEAEKFLQQSRGADKTCIFQVVRKPQELAVPGSGKLEYACRPGRSTARGRVEVVVTVSRGGRQLGRREVLYKRMYPVRKAVVVQAIAAGSPVTKENIEVRTDYAEQAPQSPWKAPYGLLATRRLGPGTMLRPSMTAEKRPDIVIRRNQMVRMRVQGPGFVITGLAQALQEGRPGGYIKVRNVDSRRIITARVAFDGSVEPVYEEVSQ